MRAAVVSGSLVLAAAGFVVAHAASPAAQAIPASPTYENGVVTKVDVKGRRITVRGGGIGEPRTFPVTGDAIAELRDVRPGNTVILRMDTAGRVLAITGNQPVSNSPVASPVPGGPRPQMVPVAPVSGVPVDEAAPPVAPGPVAPATVGAPGEVRGTPVPTPRPVGTPNPVGSPVSVSPAPARTPVPVATPRPVLVPSSAPVPPPSPPTDVEPVPTPTPSAS